MKKIQLICFAILIAFASSCKSKQTTVNSTSPAIKFNEKTFDPHFKGLGTEPFWNIEISDDFVVYKDIDGKMEVFPINSTDKAQDSNIKLIRSENGNKQLRVTITQMPCSDGMSDNTFDYKTEVSILNNDNELELKGCGNYIIPIKLQGKWTLSHLNGIDIPTDKYLKTPYLEFNSDEKRVTGNASCNGFNGAVFFDNQYIRFSNLAVTRMMCVHDNMEQEFLKEIATITNYKLIDSKLHLYKSDELKMIFQKE